MPSFCRHNRLIQNCPICAREQDLELRPVLSPGGQTARATGSSPTGPARAPSAPARSRARTSRSGPAVTVRRLARGVDDGYVCQLVPGLRSSADASRLAEELAWAAARLTRLTSAPPGLYAEVAEPGAEIAEPGAEREERSWLAFQIAYLGPLEEDDPFASITAVRTSWASGQPLSLEGATPGPRGAYAPGQPARTPAAYRAWAERSGTQATAFSGEVSWSPERRFARAFERLALPGFPRGARFELLTALGRTAVYELRAGALALGGGDEVTLAAKRCLGIGDTMLLERRAADLAAGCGLELEALDVGFYNWERGSRATLGMGTDLEPAPDVLAAVRGALNL